MKLANSVAKHEEVTREPRMKKTQVREQMLLNAMPGMAPDH
jgi:hypothetical protein